MTKVSTLIYWFDNSSDEIPGYINPNLNEEFSDVFSYIEGISLEPGEETIRKILEFAARR
jgi:hypothetical protein